MKELHVVSRERHGDKRWSRSKDYFFASQDALAAVTIQELPAAMMSTAIGFSQDKNGFFPVSLQGLMTGRNYFVSMQGKWLTSYVPAQYRTYPFKLGLNADQEAILCIDESSGLINNNSEGERFFLDDGSPAEILKEVFLSLLKYEKHQLATRAVCNLLQKYELIQPWELQVNKDGKLSSVNGLFQIDEAKLNSLPADALFELRNAGALVVAYGQLFSIQLLPHLEKLGQKAVSGIQANHQTSGDLGFSISADSGTLNFDNL